MKLIVAISLCLASLTSRLFAHCPADAAAYEKVRFLQEQLESDLQRCSFDEIESELTTSRFSFSIIENGCQPRTCALLQGGVETLKGRHLEFDELTKRYICPGNIQFLIPQAQYMSHYSNGTIIVQKTDVSYKALNPSKLRSYTLNYHWNPDKNCNYKLDYIDGNSVQCPTYMYTLPVCTNCDDYTGAKAFVKMIMNGFMGCQFNNLNPEYFLSGTKLYLHIPCTVLKNLKTPLDNWQCCSMIQPFWIMWIFGCNLFSVVGQIGEPEFVRTQGQDVVIRIRTTGNLIFYPDLFFDFVVRSNGQGDWVVVEGHMGSETICPNSDYPECGTAVCGP